MKQLPISPRFIRDILIFLFIIVCIVKIRLEALEGNNMLFNVLVFIFKCWSIWFSVTQRMLEMEKELSGMGRQNETLRREKSEIVAKLGELTAKITAMTDELEEKQSEKAVLGNELIRYREEIQHREEQIENLVKQLDQR